MTAAANILAKINVVLAHSLFQILSYCHDQCFSVIFKFTFGFIPFVVSMFSFLGSGYLCFELSYLCYISFSLIVSQISPISLLFLFPVISHPFSVRTKCFFPCQLATLTCSQLVINPGTSIFHLPLLYISVSPAIHYWPPCHKL